MKLNLTTLSGVELLPIIEGGKGIGVSNGVTAGNFAKANAIGTFSGVNAPFLDHNGDEVRLENTGKTRLERHESLISNSIRAAISQAKRAYDISSTKGRIHMNVLWEMGGCEKIVSEVLAQAKGIIHGITCGAGMPYKLAEICAMNKVHYYPIVSSTRAFRALWKRSYSKYSSWLGGVVYEDPWKAGGHNGLSNKEDPNTPEGIYRRVAEIRKYMNEVGLIAVPIIIAGGVWTLSEFTDYISNPEIGEVAFQFGTRPLLTQESPISQNWKDKLLNLKEGDVALNKFSPTGFYSSAINNRFLNNLYARSERQILFSKEITEEYNQEFFITKGKKIYISKENLSLAQSFMNQGYDAIMATPANTIIFTTPTEKASIQKDQRDCVGCLSACRFSSWTQHGNYNTGVLSDPRSYCIQKTLLDAVYGDAIEEHLAFAGHNAFRFAKDEYYNNSFVPTIAQLVNHIANFG